MSSFNYCYNISFTLTYNTSYVINRALSIYSAPISIDSMTLVLNNSNCCSIEFASRFISPSQTPPIRIQLVDKFGKWNATVQIAVDLSQLCLPVEAATTSIDVSYMVEYDSASDESLKFNDFEYEPPQLNKLVDGKYVTSRRFSVSVRRLTAEFEFSVNSLDLFRFFYLPIKLTLLNDQEGQYRVNEENRYMKSFI